MGCDEMILDSKLTKKNLMMKEVVGRDRSVVVKMKITCMVHTGHLWRGISMVTLDVIW